MRIQTHNIAQQFNREVIFKNITLEMSAPETVAILGGNGSGKSTFLSILSGKSLPAHGNITYSHNEIEIPQEKLYGYISLCAPYSAIYEQFTLEELIRFHFKFKNPVQGIKASNIPELLSLEKHKSKTIEKYSSGMKQRVKLGLAILSNTPLLLLDEPFSNLDETNQQFMSSLITEHGKNRLIIICTNHLANELKLCNRRINIEDYKK